MHTYWIHLLLILQNIYKQESNTSVSFLWKLGILNAKEHNPSYISKWFIYTKNWYPILSGPTTETNTTKAHDEMSLSETN